MVLLSVVMVGTLPETVAAQGYFGDGTGGPLGTLIGGVVNFINAILIPSILALAFLVFVWGMFRYFVAGGANDDAKEKGKSLMLYATAGFVLILIFFGIVNLLVASIGLGGAAPGGGAADEYTIPFVGPQ